MKLKDKKITIMHTVTEKNEWGDPVEKTMPIPGGENIWAYVRHASGQEFFMALQVLHRVEMIFEINWRDDIEPTHWIEYKGKRYDITRIDDFEGYKDTLRIYAYAKEG